MSITGWLAQRQQLRRSSEHALQTNLPLMTVPMAGTGIEPAAPAREGAPLPAEHLADLWPDELRGPEHREGKEARRLNDEFGWIADVAGRKLDQLTDSANVSGASSRERTQIIEEARAFAAVAAESAVRSLQRDGRHARQPAVADTAPSSPDSDEAPSTDSFAAVLDFPADPGRLDTIIGFLARQEPRIAWAAGVRADNTVVLATDIAHGWIPPRIALPADVALLAPDRRPGNATDMLGEVYPHASYLPGGAFPTGTERAPIVSVQTARVLPPAGEHLLSEIARHCADRPGMAPAVKSLIRGAAAGNPVLEKGLHTLYAHVDSARFQLLSDYPLTDRTLLADCMLMAAIEGWVTADVTAANYHFAWFIAIDHDG